MIFNIKNRNLIVIFIALISIFGCTSPKYTLKDEECPKPMVLCQPTRWTGIEHDTSEILTKLQGWHYKIEPVSLCNTEENQWAISFDNDIPYLTIENGIHQSIIRGNYLAPNRIRTEKIIQFGIEGDIGFPTFFDDNIYFGFAKDYSSSQNFYSDSAGRELTPLSEIIGQSRLMIGKIKNNEIIKAKQLDNIPTNLMDWYSHPSISTNGNLIFFSSERDSGYGGSDIWFIKKLPNGNWSAPINCGDSINSGCDEITPYISTDGKYLYYSSNGFDNVGGYDIFRARISDLINFANITSSQDVVINHIFKNRENLRPPVSTVYNEISPNCLGDCDSIFYYASNQFKDAGKKSLGGYDIFVRYKIYKIDTVKSKEQITFNIHNDINPNLNIRTQINQFYKLEGKVFRLKDNKPIPDADITIEQPSLQSRDSFKTDSTGFYSVPMLKDEEYIVTAQSGDLFPDTKKIFINQEDTINIVHQDFYLDEIYTFRINFPSDVYDKPYIYVLDTNGNETNVKWDEELDALASNLIKIKDRIDKIVIIGHTDTLASMEYNQELGQRRADFVKIELMKRGVPGYLIETRSAGELEPLPRRDNEPLDLYFKRLRRVIIERELIK